MTFKFKLTKEQSAIRRQLKLRQDALGNWEVYTTIHGSAHFRWFKISPDKADWYRANFSDIIIEQEKPNVNSTF